jgi:thioredoxin
VTITQRYGINQIPALLTIENGVVTAVRTGAASKAEMRHWLLMSIPSLRTE